MEAGGVEGLESAGSTDSVPISRDEGDELATRLEDGLDGLHSFQLHTIILIFETEPIWLPSA